MATGEGIDANFLVCLVMRGVDCSVGNEARGKSTTMQIYAQETMLASPSEQRVTTRINLLLPRLLRKPLSIVAFDENNYVSKPGT